MNKLQVIVVIVEYAIQLCKGTLRTQSINTNNKKKVNKNAEKIEKNIINYKSVLSSMFQYNSTDTMDHITNHMSTLDNENLNYDNASASAIY
jgi:hypothetical protein